MLHALFLLAHPPLPRLTSKASVEKSENFSVKKGHEAVTTQAR